MAIVACKKCGKEFYAKPSWLKIGFGKYCSADCHHASMKNGEEVPCAICGKLSYKTQKGLKGSKSGKYFCSKSCQTLWRNQLYIGPAHKNFKTGEFVYRGVIERANIPKICRLCKTIDYRVLAVHHIDKNRKNNELENLAWLCHNCHFLVHHDRSEREKLWR
ncbi:HNH endonuclease [Patescibacteria group bacterium]|nr:HNH endonuclease [Patescibacteria group bacterium]